MLIELSIAAAIPKYLNCYQEIHPILPFIKKYLKELHEPIIKPSNFTHRLELSKAITMLIDSNSIILLV